MNFIGTLTNTKKVPFKGLTFSIITVTNNNQNTYHIIHAMINKPEKFINSQVQYHYGMYNFIKHGKIVHTASGKTLTEKEVCNYLL